MAIPQPSVPPGTPQPLHAGPRACGDLPPRHTRTAMALTGIGVLLWPGGPITLIATFWLLSAQEPYGALFAALAGLLLPGGITVMGLALSLWNLTRPRQRGLFKACAVALHSLNLLGLALLAIVLMLMGLGWSMAQDAEQSTDDSYGYI